MLSSSGFPLRPPSPSEVALHPKFLLFLAYCKTQLLSPPDLAHAMSTSLKEFGKSCLPLQSWNFKTCFSVDSVYLRYQKLIIYFFLSLHSCSNNSSLPLKGKNMLPENRRVVCKRICKRKTYITFNNVQ